MALVFTLLAGACGNSQSTPATPTAAPSTQTPVAQAVPTPVTPTPADQAANLPTPSIPAPTNVADTQAPAPAAVLQETQRAHEQGAQIALANIKSLLATQDFENAQRLASGCQKDYADTTAAPQFAPLLQQAQDGVRTRAGANNDPAARHARFLLARDAAMAAMDKQDYAGAITLFQQALQEEDDGQTRAMLQHASLFVGKPRIAVAEFAVLGDVGIPDAGKAVPELMLGQFDPNRFQLVDRAWLDAVLTQQGLSMAQVSQMPEVLRVRHVDAVRYLVMGTVSRLGALTVSARLVDVASGAVVQTADVVANDPVGLQNALIELTAMLQMSNDEKANYIAFRQQQNDAMATVDPAAQAAAEAQRQAAMDAQRQQIAQAQAAAFQQQQHERDAANALADIKDFLARGDYANALRFIQWARPRFADTSAAQDLAALDTLAQTRYQQQLAQQANAAQWAQMQADLAARHQRFVQFRNQGLAALAANDMLNAMGLLQNALNEEDNADIHAVLDIIVARMQRPAIAVLDFDVRGDIGLRPREAGRWLADALLYRFSGDGSPYRIVERDEFLADLQRVGLTMADVQRDPLQPRMRLLRNDVRFIIVGTAKPGSIDLSTVMIDLAQGRPVQSAEFIAENLRALPDALAGSAIVLQMTDDQKQAYLAQIDYANWMGRGDTAASAQQWDVALDAYTRAYRISNNPDALDHMTAAARQLEDYRRMRRDYDAAMAAAGDAARRNNWDQALDLYHQALAIMPTPEARAGLENARAKVIAAARDRHALYLTSMANGDTFVRNDDWPRALDAYQQATQIEPTAEAAAAAAQAQRTITDRQQAKDRAYASAMDIGRTAIKNGSWAHALESFTQAAGVKDTAEAASGIATARRKLAQQDADAKLYDAAMQDADTAIAAGDWPKALDFHQRAQGIRNTESVRAAIIRDRARVAQMQNQDQKQQYDTFMAKAANAVAAGQWQDALDAYRAAYQYQKTQTAAAGITQATKMLNDVQFNKKQYDKAMADAAAAAQTGTWQKALVAYQQAASIDSTAEAKAGVERARAQLADAANAQKKQQYTSLMTAGDTAAKAGDWKKALGSYTQAAAVDKTPEAQAGIANAQQKSADANAAAASAAQQKQKYTQFLTAGDAAAKANDWQKALDAYKQAAAIDNTPAAQAGIANAQKKLADASAAGAAAAAANAAAADRKQQYDRLMADGNTAATANDWPKALDAFNKAAAVDNTAQVQAAVANAKKKFSDATAAQAAAQAAADKKKQYDQLMTNGDTAAKAGDWQKALDSYTQAAAVDNTAEVRTNIANARKKISDAAAATAAAAAADKKAQYDRLHAQGDAAAKANDWQKALDSYTQAQAIDNTAEVRTDILNARKKISDAAAAAAAQDAQTKQYTVLMTEGDTAAKASAWQTALDAYTKAAAIDNTQPAQAGIANAKAKLADASAAAAAAADKKRQYDRAMADGSTAARANDWQKALDAYNQAAVIDNTQEVQTAIANAKKKLADAATAQAAAQAATQAAAARKAQYDRLHAQGDAFAKANDWQKALDSYTQAQAIDNTAEVKTDIANVKKKLADAAATQAAADVKKKQYATFMTDGDTAAKANAWQRALDAYTKAAAIDNTQEAQAGIANAKSKLADAAAAAQAAADKKKQYTSHMTEGAAAARANEWQKALDAYTQAQVIDDTAEVKAAIANATKKLADTTTAADKKKQYDQLMSDADAAGKANDWQKAFDDYTKAEALDNTPAVRTALANAKKKAYDQYMTEGDTAGKANDWQKALDAYTKAAAVDNTAAVKTAIANTKLKLPAGR